jgi:4-hydroxy-3-methylbut-2-enyl diphosphate reductase
MKLQGAKNNFYIYALSGCFVYTLTLANRGEYPTVKKSRLFRILAGVLLTCYFAYKLNVYVFVPVITFVALGLVYPYRHKLKGFTALRGTRDIVTALGWCFVCACVPALAQGLIFTKSAWLALAYGALLVFVRSVILSIGTEHKDILLGQESFYKAFGIAKTKAAIAVIILGLTLVLAQLILMGWKKPLVFMLLLGLFYTVTIAAYFYHKARPRTALSDAIIDGQFYLLALLAFCAVNFI